MSNPQINKPTAETALSLWPNVLVLWRSLEPRQRRGFGKLILLSMVASIGEMVSIGSLLPFLAILVNPQTVTSMPAAQTILSALGITAAQDMLLIFGALFGVLVLIAATVRWTLSAACARYAYRAGTVLGQQIFDRALTQPYHFYLTRHSSEVIDVVSERLKTVIGSVLMGGLALLTNLLMVVAIIITLIWINPLMVGLTAMLFGLLYVVIYQIFKQRLRQNSQRISAVSSKRFQILQEGMGGLRDIHLDGTANYFVDAFAAADHAYQEAVCRTQIISTSPRFLVEGIGTVLIAAVALIYALQIDTDLTTLIPSLGVLVMAAQRMLPMLQKVYTSWSHIHGVEHTLAVVNQWMALPICPPPRQRSTGETELGFTESLELRDVQFQYGPQSALVLKNINLLIKRGQCIGLCGSTGVGKSTLLDLLMGLIEPTRGHLWVDSQALDLSSAATWRRQIAHVPQHIFLADTSIARNIAFGQSPDTIDMHRIEVAAQRAQLSTFIASCPKGFETMVGEQGIRLSGGQRQRVGVARALYKQAALLVLDEATSALDPATEAAMTASLADLHPELTVVMVSHRPSALKNCDVVYQLTAKGLIELTPGLATEDGVSEPETCNNDQRQRP